MATNSLIKRANSQTEFTPESVQELKKCKNDPIYFIRNYVKIQHPTDGTVPFDLYEYQIEMIDHIHNNKKSLLMASRQLGKCLFSATKINIIKKPNIIKKIIVFLLDKKLYSKIKNL
jgi:hypothetical protein